jgi:hypothetical protein
MRRIIVDRRRIEFDGGVFGHFISLGNPEPRDL